MICQRKKVWEPRGVAMVMGLGLVFFSLGSLPSTRAQQPATTPTVQPVVASKGASAPAAPSDAPKTSLNEYTVSPEDLLDIIVLDVPEVTRTYRVSSNGLLSLPLLPEPFPAAGETLDQLSHLIATKFRDAGMLNNAQVTVSLKETRQHTVMVSGEVKKAQAFPIYGPTRLLDILIQAGGITENAGDEAIITRGDLGARADLEESARSGEVNPTARGLTFSLDIRKLVQTGADKSNILLYPGDRVTVQRAMLVYVMGAVTRPGGYVLNESRQEVTVLKALAMAGDVTSVAKRGKITLLRHDPATTGEKRDEIPVNYKAIVKGQVADIRMKADDILFVPESGRIKAMRTTIAALVATGTNVGGAMAIYH
jgi:polysaccharide export outer membrane protein